MKQWFKIAIDFKNDYVEDWILNPRQALMDGVTVNSLEYLQNTTSTAWGKKKKKKKDPRVLFEQQELHQNKATNPIKDTDLTSIRKVTFST